jgi:hypothetical protein
MSAISKQQIHDDVLAHIKKEGGNFNTWYVGITADVNQRLFTEHNVPRKNAWFIYREAFSADDAREVEKSMIEKYGTKGGPGGGDNNSKYVYAYKITSSTIE